MMAEPTPDEIEHLVRMAQTLPITDIARQMYEIQSAGIDTAGGQMIRRALVEILALRVTVRRMQQGH